MTGKKKRLLEQGRREADRRVQERHPEALRKFLFAYYDCEVRFDREYTVYKPAENAFTVWKKGAGEVFLTVDPDRLSNLPDTDYREQFRVLARVLSSYSCGHARRLSLEFPFYDALEHKSMGVQAHLERCLAVTRTESRFEYLVRRLNENCKERANEIEWSKWQRGLPGHTWKPPLKAKVTVKGTTVKVKYTEVLTGRSRCEVFSAKETELQRLTQDEVERLAQLHKEPFY